MNYRRETFNRTILGLKSGIGAVSELAGNSFNRTILGLKFSIISLACFF